MRSEDLFIQLHQVSIDEFLPIACIDNEVKKQYYKKLGYPISYSIQEWINKYPFIDPNKIYYHKVYFIGVYYYDPSEYTLIELPVFPNFYSIKSVQNMFTQELNRCHNNFLNKNWNALLLKVNRAYKIDIVANMVKNEEPDSNLYDAFVKSYCSSEYGFEKFDNTLILKVISGKSSEQINATYNALSKLPASPLIYCGGTDKSRDYRETISWTLDKKVARFFATRFESEEHYIIEGKINKKYIFEYIENEKEVLVYPDRVEYINKTFINSK